MLAAGAALLHALMAALVLSVVARGEPIGDWVPFYTAGSIVRGGDGAHLYNPATQQAAQAALFGEAAARDYFYFALPSFTAFLFAPLSWLSFAASYLTWLGVNVVLLAALLAAAWRWLRASDVAVRGVYVACAAASVPVLNVLLLGQVDLFVVAGIGACYALLRRGQPFGAGAALSLALFKPHLAAGAVLLLIVKREWRALAGFATTGGPLLLVPTLLLGPRALWEQASALASFPGHTGEQRVNAEMMVNVRGAIVSVTGSSHPLLWAPPLALIAAVAVVAAVRAWRRRPATDEQAWAVAFVLPLLCSPHLHMQSIALLLAAAACYLIADEASGRPRVRTAHVLGAFVAMTVLWAGALAGVALAFVPIVAAYWLIVRCWPQPAAAGAADERAELRKAG